MLKGGLKFLLGELLDHPIIMGLLVLAVIASVVGVIWFNVRETAEKDAERKRDREIGGSIWDD